jgi:hypothetical protein
MALRAFGFFDHQAPAVDVRVGHAARHEAPAQAAQLGVQLGLHAGHGEHVCPLSRPKVSPAPRCTVSATATARWRWITRHSRARARQWPAGGGAPRRRQRSLRPAVCCECGWCCTSVGRDANGQIGLARWSAPPACPTGLIAQADAGGGARAKKASHSSITVALAMMCPPQW